MPHSQSGCRAHVLGMEVRGALRDGAHDFAVERTRFARRSPRRSPHRRSIDPDHGSSSVLPRVLPTPTKDASMSPGIGKQRVLELIEKLQQTRRWRMFSSIWCCWRGPSAGWPSWTPARESITQRRGVSTHYADLVVEGFVAAVRRLADHPPVDAPSLSSATSQAERSVTALPYRLMRHAPPPWDGRRAPGRGCCGACQRVDRAGRPATARTLRGAASQMAAAESALPPMAIEKAAA